MASVQPGQPPVHTAAPLERISVGDLMQRVAVGIHLEMDQLRSSMRTIDPELRTVSMRAFTSRTLKKLTQLYAIIRWIQQPGPPAFLDSLSNLRTQIKDIDFKVSEIQDRLFWTHSFMFSMRSRPLEISAACDLLAKGTYDQLPEAIWTCGKELQPGAAFSSFTAADKTALVGELNTFIRAKLALDDPVPAGLSFAGVDGGYLRLRQDDLWEATVSLDHLSQRAHWVVLSARILVGSHAVENLSAGFDHESLERDLLYILRAHAGGARDSAAEREERGKQEQAAAAAAAAAANTQVIIKADPGGVPTQSKPRGPASKSSKDAAAPKKAAAAAKHLRVFTLRHLQAVCQHLALSTALRFFYIQGCELSRGLWQGRLEAEFLDDMTSTQATFRFWRCSFTNAYQFQARIEQQRSVAAAAAAAGANAGARAFADGEASKAGVLARPPPFGGLGRPLVAHLYCTEISSVENTPDGLLPVPHFAGVPELMVNQYVVGGGVTYRRYFEAVLYSLAQCKMQLLMARLSQDPHIRAALSGALLLLQKDAVGVLLILGEAKLRICIDAQSGDYSAQIRGSITPSPALSTGVRTFLTELNNLETQRALRDILVEMGMQELLHRATHEPAFVKNRVRALATTSQLLQQMVLAAAERALLDGGDSAAGSGGGSSSSSLSPGGELLTPSLLSRAGAGMESGSERICTVLHVRSYASLQLVAAKSQPPRPALAIYPQGSAWPTADYSGSVGIEGALSVPDAGDASAAYRAGRADFGLFVVLTTDERFYTTAYAVLAGLRSTERDGVGSADVSQIAKKKAKKAGLGKQLTPGQLSALRAKEAEEEAAQQAAAARAAESAAALATAADSLNSSRVLSFQILRCTALPHWKLAPLAKMPILKASVSQLLSAVQQEETLWLRRPLPPLPANLPAESSLSLGTKAVVRALADLERGCYRLQFTFTTDSGSGSGSATFSAFLAFVSPSTSGDRGTVPRAAFLGCSMQYTARADAGEQQQLQQTPRFVPVFDTIARQYIHALTTQSTAAVTTGSPDAVLHRLMVLSLPSLAFLWQVEEHASELRPPLPRPLLASVAATSTGAPAAAESDSAAMAVVSPPPQKEKASRGKKAAAAAAAAANLGPLVATSVLTTQTSKCFLKVLSVGVGVGVGGDAAGCPTVDYSANMRVYLDDGMGEASSVTVGREEVAGVVSAAGVGGGGGAGALQLQLQGLFPVQMPPIPIDFSQPVGAVCTAAVRALGLSDP